MVEDYGIKMSKTGTNVKTATEDDVVMTSARNCLKVNTVVHDTITTNGSGIATKTITHTLGFVPIVVLVIDYLDSFYFVPFSTLGVTSVSSYLRISDADFILSFTDTDNPSTEFDFYYFLSETENAT